MKPSPALEDRTTRTLSRAPWIVPLIVSLTGCEPAAPPVPGCSDTCDFADDGQCDDGAGGAVTSRCEYGTDCGDCGPRSVSDAGPSRADGGDSSDAGAQTPACGFGSPGRVFSLPSGRSEAADVDGDGFVDVVYVSDDTGFDLRIRYGDASGGLGDPQSFSCWRRECPAGATIADLDEDGRLDVIAWSLSLGSVTHAWTSPRGTDYPATIDYNVFVYWNEGARTFAPPDLLLAMGRVRTVHARDLTGDGRLDLVAEASVGRWTQPDGGGTLVTLAPGGCAFYGFVNAGDRVLGVPGFYADLGTGPEFEGRDPNGALGSPLPSGATSCTNPFAVVADVTGDGRPELAGMYWARSSTDRVVDSLVSIGEIHASGAVRLANVRTHQAIAPNGFVVWDIEHDGDGDLVFDGSALRFDDPVLPPPDPFVIYDEGWEPISLSFPYRWGDVLGWDDLDGDGLVDLWRAALSAGSARLAYRRAPAVAHALQYVESTDALEVIGTIDDTGDSPEVVIVRTTGARFACE